MAKQRPDLRAAYRAAWAERRASGDTSDEVLLRHLRPHEQLVGPNHASTFETILGFWRRGVSPRTLSWEVAKVSGRALLQVGRAYWAIFQMFRGTAVPVPFEPVLSAEDLTRLMVAPDHPVLVESFGHEVWFDVRTTVAPAAQVMWDDVVIGHSELPLEDWTELRANTEEHLYGSGVLGVRVQDGLLVIEDLHYDGIRDVNEDDDDDEDDDADG
jgi:hypothetical protein